VICSSEDGLDPRIALIGAETGPIPEPGEFVIRPPSANRIVDTAIKVVFAFAPDKAIEGLIDPAIFNEVFDFYAHEVGSRVFILYGDADVLTSFGEPLVTLPPDVDLLKAGSIQWTDGGICRVTASQRYPISTVAVIPTASVSSKWARTAIEFSLAGAAIAALLATLVIRVVRRTRSVEADLREAVKYDELDVHYQPIMDLRSNRCVGAEALMRWNHPQRGMIPASEFIAVAEKTDLIVPMTALMLERVAEDLEDTLDADPELHININLAAQHFSTRQIIDSIHSILGGRIRANQIIFEITERGLVDEHTSPAAAVMRGLSQTGSRLAVDDFGTGYSCLSYLQRFPLHFLKIDKAYVDGISDAEHSSGLVDQIIRIAKSVNMELIAEGVEHEYQVQYLLNQGVEYGQGWHFGRPMSANRFISFVSEKNAPAAS
jgi:sensor c-di-GMP phosphodiesterase-like protein